MTNPVWAWLARNPELNAYQANQLFDGPSSFGGNGPVWCNQRFGQSTTVLPDGRIIAIGGEHEDYYDPDFCIYNDVHVIAPDGSVELFGYPRDVFPPTDFHTATLADDHIVVVGNLGYADERGTRTQVCRLELSTLAMSILETSGESPGWLGRHAAVLDKNSIQVRGGRVEVHLPDGTTLRDNADDFVLDLATLAWRRTTDRRWSQFALSRTDGRGGGLWHVSSLEFVAGRDDEWSRGQVAWHREQLGYEPDLEAWAARHRPPVAHEIVPPREDDEDRWRTQRIVVDGVIVRYVDETQVVIEGVLPPSTIEAIVEDLRQKLGRVEGAEYRVRCLTPR